MLLKCSSILKYHKNISNLIDSKICCENFLKSKKPLYLVDIRRLVKGTMKLGRLLLVARMESLLNLANGTKIMSLGQTL